MPIVYDRDKEHLYPPFAKLLVNFEARLLEAGLHFYIFEGLRSWEVQKAYWDQGRTTPGEIITRAEPGYSWHQYGLAADYVLDGVIDKPGVQWSWDIKADLNMDGRVDWVQMAEVAAKCGLTSGWYWPDGQCDPPHVQNRFGLSIIYARHLFHKGGLPEVWRVADDWLNKYAPQLGN